MSGRGGGVRAPISIGIQPQIALYSVILGTVCALAAYTEKYSRKEEELDVQLKQRYYADMMDQRAKIPAMTQTIREGGVKLDGTMNQWVWGGKANLPGAGGGFGGGRGHSNFSVVEEDQEEASTTNTSSSSRSMDEDEDSEEELTNKERKRRRKERKRKRAERRKQKEEEEQLRLQATQKKLVVQSVMAGAAVGAVAVAASVMMGSSRK